LLPKLDMLKLFVGLYPKGVSAFFLCLQVWRMSG